MAKNSKVTIVILIVLTIIFFIGSISLYYIGDREKALRRKVEQDLLQMIELKKTLEEKAKELETTNTALTEKLQQKNEDLDLRAKELREVKEIKESYYLQLREQIEMTDQLQLQLSEEKTLSQNLRLAAEKIEQRYKQLADHFSSVISAKDKLQKTLTQLKTHGSVDLEKIIIAPTANEEEIEDIIRIDVSEEGEGSILLVNTQYQFAIVDLGKKDNVKVGDSLSVIREGKEIGALSVDKVYDDMASAGITSLHQGYFLKIHDRVEIEKK